MSEQDIIQFQEVTLEIPSAKFENLFDLSLSIRRGEFFGLCGTPRSGAQTLCLAINGLAPHATGGKLCGHVVVKGLDTREHPPKQLALHVGIVFDDPEGQFLGMTVEDHVSFAPENLNLPVPEIYQRVEWALNAVGMLGMRKRLLTDLSGGQKQRVAIAAALAMHPDILVLSDVTFALDPVGANEVYTVARRLNTELGMTVIILDQDTEKLCEYCDRVAILDAGRIAAVGTPEEIFPALSARLRAAIRVPQVTELFAAMRAGGAPLERIPVKLEDAVALWQRSGLALAAANGNGRGNGSGAEPVIQIRDLVYCYSAQIRALNGISLEIKRGEFVGLIGQNGSGKTTLVKHLIGLLTPTSGDVIVNGQDTRGLSIGSLARIVGYVFQNPDHQIFTSSVRQELSYGPTNLGIAPEEIEARVTRVATALGLVEHLDTDPYQLSRGERQRVAIGSILTMGPKILVLDEPTTGLYTEETRETLDYIRRLNEQEKLTIIMISHDMRLVSEYCGRVVVLADGDLVADGRIEQVFANQAALARASLYPPQITQFAGRVIPHLDRAVLSPQGLSIVR